MALLRKYKHGDPGNVGPEIINSRPIPIPPAQVSFDVTPHGDVVSLVTPLGTYTWSEVLNGLSGVVVPAMYYHQVGIELTFTASLRTEIPARTIIEYYWDFGDGTNATGAVVNKTYSINNPGIIAHLRATENTGQQAFASMNLMLVPTPPPDPEWLAWPDRWSELA